MLEHPTQGSQQRQSSSREGEEAEEAYTGIPWLPRGRGGPLDRENRVAPNTVYVTLEQNLQMRMLKSG